MNGLYYSIFHIQGQIFKMFLVPIFWGSGCELKLIQFQKSLKVLVVSKMVLWVRNFPGKRWPACGPCYSHKDRRLRYIRHSCPLISSCALWNMCTHTHKIMLLYLIHIHILFNRIEIVTLLYIPLLLTYKNFYIHTTFSCKTKGNYVGMCSQQNNLMMEKCWSVYGANTLQKKLFFWGVILRQKTSAILKNVL